MLATVVDSQSEASTPPTQKEKTSQQRKRLLSKAFRFHLKNFLPGGGDLSLRRFSMTEAAFLLVMAFLVSHGLGAIRQVIFNAIFGTSPEADAYYAAARLPEVLFDLIAGGALTHAFIPVFLSYEKDHGQREAWRLASLVFNVLLVILTALVFVSEFVAPTFVSRLLVPGYSAAEQALTTQLTRIMLVQPLILGLGTVATALLNSRRQFLLPAISLAIYNVGLIGGLLFTLADPGLGIYGPTYGVIAAATLQVVVMLPGLVKQGMRYTFIWDLKHRGLHEVMRLLGPNVLGVAIASVGFVVDTAYISYMPDKASLAAARNAHLLFALPLALVAQAIGQAVLPHLATLATSARYARLRATIVKVMGGALLLSLVFALMLYFFGKPAIEILYQHGAFKKHSATVTGTALLGYAVALPGLTLADLLVLGFFALKDTKTPLFTHIMALAIRWGLIILLLRSLTGSHVILAIPLAIAGAGSIEALLLGYLLHIRLRSKVKLDKAMQRLERRRRHDTRTTTEREPQVHLSDPSGQHMEALIASVAVDMEKTAPYLHELESTEQHMSEVEQQEKTELLVTEPEVHQPAEHHPDEAENQKKSEQLVTESEDHAQGEDAVHETEDQEQAQLPVNPQKKRRRKQKNRRRSE